MLTARRIAVALCLFGSGCSLMPRASVVDPVAHFVSRTRMQTAEESSGRLVRITGDLTNDGLDDMALVVPGSPSGELWKVYAGSPRGAYRFIGTMTVDPGRLAVEPVNAGTTRLQTLIREKGGTFSDREYRLTSRSLRLARNTPLSAARPAPLQARIERFARANTPSVHRESCSLQEYRVSRNCLWKRVRG